MYSAFGVRSARIIPKWVRNSSWASRSGDRSRPKARSLTLMTGIVVSPFPSLSVEPGGQQPTAVIVPEIGPVVLDRAVPHEDDDGRVDLRDVLLGRQVALDLVEQPSPGRDVLRAPLADEEIGQHGVVDLGHVARVTREIVGEEIVVGVQEGRGPIVHRLVVAGGAG